ncbi:MAG: hypothetical protein GEV28_28695 [Actinophytocola sp.]|uniref:hypothetical protein n=1 Tax=Actinophytocola sp. TaxID=1872138 RepID=UPI00132CA0AA|nr:hypothetical protein [Actinophytocola sp.]MPZ84164.1 hypothetical protein [Actinophytocola sp.]
MGFDIKIGNLREYALLMNELGSDMRGFDPHQRPADAADVLEAFLRLARRAGRAMRYRDRLAGRRGLVLLDNGADLDQVRPLQPGDPGCLVLVTTRRTLAELDGAGHLPLLLAPAARRLRARPTWELADMAGRLAEHDRDDCAAVGSFALSYDSLSPATRRVFRLLGSHPGTDFTPMSAAALADLPADEAAAALETLLDEHLLRQQTAGRYRFHDFLRRYAREMPDDERGCALRRCLTWLPHSADNAVQTLERHRRRTFPLSTPDCRVPAARFDGYPDALAWCEAERATLVAAVHAAAAAGLTALAWQLPAVLLRYFYLRSHWADWLDWLDTHRVALAAVRESADRRGEATILNGLGVAYGDLRMPARPASTAPPRRRCSASSATRTARRGASTTSVSPTSTTATRPRPSTTSAGPWRSSCAAATCRARPSA